MTALGALGTASVSWASCTPQATTTPFAQFGDTGSYFLAPGGSFEGPSTSWGLSNAQLTAGNEPFYVNSPTDNQSLTIAAGGSAITPAFCLDTSMPPFRFIARQASPGSDLQVTLQIQSGNGARTVATLADLGDATMATWAPTAALSSQSSLLPPGQQVNAQLKFSVPQNTGAWQIDDVFIDPYRA
jgi:hypothetical protein